MLATLGGVAMVDTLDEREHASTEPAAEADLLATDGDTAEDSDADTAADTEANTAEDVDDADTAEDSDAAELSVDEKAGTRA
jgi:hypothetical protein